MSKPNSSSSYPLIFVEVLQRFAAGETRIEIVEEDEKMLKNLRFSFYSFRKALKREEQGKAHKLCENMDAITATIARDTPVPGLFTLSFHIIDYDRLFGPLRRALDATPTASITLPATPSSSGSTQAAQGPASTASEHDNAIARYLGKDES